MKKVIIAVALSILSFTSFAQKDSVKVKDTLYYIVGKMENFQLIYGALKSPGDVTPNQINALLVWIDKNLAILPQQNVKPKK